MISVTYGAGNASLQVKEHKKKLKHEDIMQKPFSKADKRLSTQITTVRDTRKWYKKPLGATVS